MKPVIFSQKLNLQFFYVILQFCFERRNVKQKYEQIICMVIENIFRYVKSAQQGKMISKSIKK